MAGVYSDKENYLENEYVEFWIEEDIVMEYFKPHVVEINLDMAKQIVSDRLKVSQKVARPLFINVNNVKNMTKEARDYFSEGESVMYISASAFVLNNYVAWAVGKLFLAFNKPKTHIELFRTRHKGMEWLRFFKNVN